MDGNGRWAAARGRPRIAGHRRGARSVRRVVEASPEFGITTLTLYAFSSDNWGRPADEVAGLMDLFLGYLRRECQRCVDSGVRLSVIGRRDRLGPALIEAIERTEARTAAGSTLHLRLAVDYSARDAIVRAAAGLRDARVPSVEEFSRRINEATHSAPCTPDVDLLIRTSGERRLSDFLLWESAYAELLFTACPWPEFGKRELGGAIREFHRRERRFGRLHRGAQLVGSSSSENPSAGARRVSRIGVGR